MWPRQPRLRSRRQPRESARIDTKTHRRRCCRYVEAPQTLGLILAPAAEPARGWSSSVQLSPVELRAKRRAAIREQAKQARQTGRQADRQTDMWGGGQTGGNQAKQSEARELTGVV